MKQIDKMQQILALKKQLSKARTEYLALHHMLTEIGSRSSFSGPGLFYHADEFVQSLAKEYGLEQVEIFEKLNK